MKKQHNPMQTVALILISVLVFWMDSAYAQQLWQGQEDYDCSGSNKELKRTDVVGTADVFAIIAASRDRGTPLEEELTTPENMKEILAASAFEREGKAQDDRTVRIIYANPQLTPQQVASLYRHQCMIGLYGTPERKAATALRHKQFLRERVCQDEGHLAMFIVHWREEGRPKPEALQAMTQQLAFRAYRGGQTIAEWTTKLSALYMQPKLSAVQAWQREEQACLIRVRGQQPSAQTSPPSSEILPKASPSVEKPTPAPAAEQPDILTGQTYVRQMITDAMVKGGVGNEEAILATKRRIEALKPKRLADVNARKRARSENERGLQYISNGQITEAAQVLQVAYQADPTDVEIINNLGDAYQRLSNIQAAEPLLLRALVFAPGRSNAWANLGHTYAKQGQQSAAVACYANAYRFSRNQDATRQLFQKWAEEEEGRVREAVQQTLRLPFVQTAKN